MHGARTDQQQVTTGTANRQLDTAQTGLGQLTTELTPTAFPTGNSLSLPGTNGKPNRRERLHHKEGLERTLGTEQTGFATHGTREGEIRLRGLEPLTFGSVDRRSIQLSYRRSISK